MNTDANEKNIQDIYLAFSLLELNQDYKQSVHKALDNHKVYGKLSALNYARQAIVTSYQKFLDNRIHPSEVQPEKLKEIAINQGLTENDIAAIIKLFREHWPNA